MKNPKPEAAKADVQRRPDRPPNHLVNSLRGAVLEIFMFLGEEVASPALAEKFGVNHPSHLQANQLIDAADMLHMKADALEEQQRVAEAAKLLGDGGGKSESQYQSEAEVGGAKPSGGGPVPGEDNTSGGPAATPPAPLKDQQNDASKQ